MGSTGERHIVLVRGINVGGRAKLPMATLREACAGIGCTNVTTYIQSGNAVLDSALPAAKLATSLESAIGEAVGFTPRVIVRTADDVVRVLEHNPYPDTDERFLHIGFLDQAPTRAAVDKLGRIDCEPEGYQIRGREVYLNFVHGVGQSKALAKVPFDRLGVSMTARNLRTVKKLADLAIT